MEELDVPQRGTKKRRPIREPSHEMPDDENPGETHYEEEYPEYSDNESFEGQSPMQKRKVPGLAQKVSSPRHKGQPLPEEIAKSINYLLSYHLEEPTMDAIVNKYEIPQNCALFGVPSVNSEVWNSGLAQTFSSPRHKGQPLPEEIAESINYLHAHHLEEPTMDEIVNKYEIPQNCALLGVPSVNNEVWNYMGTAVRAQEMRLQRVLRLMGSSIMAFARDLEEGNVTTSQQDVMGMMCNAHFEINCIRKSAIRPNIHPKFAGLCKPSNIQLPYLLFGEELVKKLKVLNEESKTIEMMKPPMFGSTARRQYPYRRGTGEGTSRSYPHTRYWRTTSGRGGHGIPTRGKVQKVTPVNPEMQVHWDGELLMPSQAVEVDGMQRKNLCSRHMALIILNY
ncbi:uncharacterized protein LOC129705380 isoform X2 [Leucoraja erinacea]|uniref:uncharacterized protein LOC129705380 isoform X2 n=1 Tax=Leucoraja erinaceus TaxID=7782 RepID=UPI0024537F8F|nr:uncharacterized protein LOC129705380 isoform X2 [Leucoraja erinacea]